MTRKRSQVQLLYRPHPIRIYTCEPDPWGAPLGVTHAHPALIVRVLD